MEDMDTTSESKNSFILGMNMDPDIKIYKQNTQVDDKSLLKTADSSIHDIENVVEFSSQSIIEKIPMKIINSENSINHILSEQLNEDDINIHDSIPNDVNISWHVSNEQDPMPMENDHNLSINRKSNSLQLYNDVLPCDIMNSNTVSLFLESSSTSVLHSFSTEFNSDKLTVIDEKENTNVVKDHSIETKNGSNQVNNYSLNSAVESNNTHTSVNINNVVEKNNMNKNEQETNLHSVTNTMNEYTNEINNHPFLTWASTDIYARLISSAGDYPGLGLVPPILHLQASLALGSVGDARDIRKSIFGTISSSDSSGITESMSNSFNTITQVTTTTAIPENISLSKIRFANTLVVSPCSGYLAIGCSDGQLLVMEIDTTFAGLETYNTSTVLAAAAAGSSLPVLQILAHNCMISQLAWSTDGKNILSLGIDDATIRGWDVSTGQMLFSYTAVDTFTLYSFSIAPFKCKCLKCLQKETILFVFLPTPEKPSAPYIAEACSDCGVRLVSSLPSDFFNSTWTDSPLNLTWSMKEKQNRLHGQSNEYFHNFSCLCNLHGSLLVIGTSSGRILVYQIITEKQIVNINLVRAFGFSQQLSISSVAFIASRAHIENFIYDDLLSLPTNLHTIASASDVENKHPLINGPCIFIPRLLISRIDGMLGIFCINSGTLLHLLHDTDAGAPFVDGDKENDFIMDILTSNDSSNADENNIDKTQIKQHQLQFLHSPLLDSTDKMHRIYLALDAFLLKVSLSERNIAGLRNFLRTRKASTMLNENEIEQSLGKAEKSYENISIVPSNLRVELLPGLDLCEMTDQVSSSSHPLDDNMNVDLSETIPNSHLKDENQSFTLQNNQILALSNIFDEEQADLETFRDQDDLHESKSVMSNVSEIEVDELPTKNHNPKTVSQESFSTNQHYPFSDLTFSLSSTFSLETNAVRNVSPPYHFSPTHRNIRSVINFLSSIGKQRLHDLSTELDCSSTVLATLILEALQKLNADVISKLLTNKNKENELNNSNRLFNSHYPFGDGSWGNQASKSLGKNVCTSGKLVNCVGKAKGWMSVVVSADGSTITALARGGGNEKVNNGTLSPMSLRSSSSSHEPAILYQWHAYVHVQPPSSSQFPAYWMNSLIYRLTPSSCQRLPPFVGYSRDGASATPLALLAPSHTGNSLFLSDRYGAVVIFRPSMTNRSLYDQNYNKVDTKPWLWRTMVPTLSYPELIDGGSKSIVYAHQEVIANASHTYARSKIEHAIVEYCKKSLQNEIIDASVSNENNIDVGFYSQINPRIPSLDTPIASALRLDGQVRIGSFTPFLSSNITDVFHFEPTNGQLLLSLPKTYSSIPCQQLFAGVSIREQNLPSKIRNNTLVKSIVNTNPLSTKQDEMTSMSTLVKDGINQVMATTCRDLAVQWEPPSATLQAIQWSSYPKDMQGAIWHEKDDTLFTLPITSSSNFSLEEDELGGGEMGGPLRHVRLRVSPLPIARFPKSDSFSVTQTDSLTNDHVVTDSVQTSLKSLETKTSSNRIVKPTKKMNDMLLESAIIFHDEDLTTSDVIARKRNRREKKDEINNVSIAKKFKLQNQNSSTSEAFPYDSQQNIESSPAT